MLSTVLTSTTTILTRESADDEITGDLGDMADNMSSSLSELGDASDDQSEPALQPLAPAPAPAGSEEDASEAETERLEKTPRKLVRTGTDTSLLSEPLHARSPSRLAYTAMADQENLAPGTSVMAGDMAASEIAEAASSGSGSHSSSLAATSKIASLEYTGKKRKRVSVERTSIDEQDVDERFLKRTAPVNMSNELSDSIINESAQANISEEHGDIEEQPPQISQEELDPEEAQADLTAEAVNRLAIVAKGSRPRKGDRRGKRKMEDLNDPQGEPCTSIDPQDPEVDGDGDEEDGAAFDEEIAKKQAAINQLAKIEQKFKVFREKLCDEQIAQYERELHMLKQPNCLHPEYLAMIKCISERRSDKIAYETRLLEYKQKNLETITTAERHQMHSQYFQTVRHVREDVLAECNQRVFELQRGRRQLGCDETQYMIRLPERRSDQIKHQTAYNLEVSILSGVAKYIGFPAAPDIKPAQPSEIDQDLRAMNIITRAPVPPPSFRTYNRTTTADEAAAEEQFLESTPWANPRHPSHQEARCASGASRVPSYQTPVGQRCVAADSIVLNGSASTIDMTSTPSPSAACNPSGRLGQSESPMLQMKRAPNDHSAHARTSSSHPRHSGVPRREAYEILSSPAVPPNEHGGQHWVGGNIQPLGVEAAGPPPGPSGPSRSDSAHISLAQRSTVSVGSGLFGR